LKLAPHFIQVGERPALIGNGPDDLLCGCGRSVLVKGYLPANLLAIDIRCGHCNAVTTTPGLPDGASPPFAVIPVRRTEEPLPRPATVARLSALASQEEIDRLSRLYTPRTPPNDLCIIDTPTLDEVAADYDRCTDGRLHADLAEVGATSTLRTAGIKTHPLAWAIRHLRSAQLEPRWRCIESDEASVATTIVAAFRHFSYCWSHHPLFGIMAATVADQGFSLHALAQFGAAKCLADAGNRIAFPAPADPSGRLANFFIAVGPSDRLAVIVEPFDRFEWPTGGQWTPASLRAAAANAIAASQAKINPRRPGFLVLSAGAAASAFDQPFVEAIGHANQVHGRRHRGVGAICAILPRITATEGANVVFFKYAFYPVPNRHFVGDVIPRIGGRPDAGPL
jgi:hypothetical protein